MIFSRISAGRSGNFWKVVIGAMKGAIELLLERGRASKSEEAAMVSCPGL
jgi:hypothetical protein